MPGALALGPAESILDGIPPSAGNSAPKTFAVAVVPHGDSGQATLASTTTSDRLKRGRRGRSSTGRSKLQAHAGLPVSVLCPDRAAVRSRDLSHDGQPETVARRT